MRRDGILRILGGERFTPFTLAKKLDAKVILESSSFKKGKERYSILLIREAFRIQQWGHEVFLLADGESEKMELQDKEDILDVLLSVAGENVSLHQDLPLPAGGVGFLSYEFASHCDRIFFRKKEDELDLPEGEFMFGHVFIIFDHYSDMLYLIGLNYNEHEIDLEKAIRETEDRINDMDFNYLSSRERVYASELPKDESDRELFYRGVKKIRQEIIKGNLLQGVLSRRLRIKTELPPLEAYKNLRSVNPSPYLFYIDFGGYQLFGSSPEVMIKVKEEKVISRPIAGTRRRGKDSGEDTLLEEELLADEKERAEHLMLVDLARNDLGRFCKPGSIIPSEYMGVEYYSHVMHIVSQVEGVLDEGMTGIDAVRATFPAGTVSGAPKIRAIEIIDEIEEMRRGFYAGLVGYMEPDGSLDTCITIRSALKKNGILYLQAGAGIVYDSIPEREYEETCEKLRALAFAVGVEV